MKKSASFLFVLSFALVIVTSSCKKNKEEKDVCNTFFTENAMKVNFTAGAITTNFQSTFTKGNAYEVTISANGNISVASNSTTYSFTKEMIYECNIGTTTNIDYENTETNFVLYLTKTTSGSAESFSLVLYNVGTLNQATLNYEVN